MKRIQRKRSKGWRLPKNAVCIDRTTKWGNPVKLVGDAIYINAAYRRANLDPWVYLQQGDINDLLRIYKDMVTGNFSMMYVSKLSNADIWWWTVKFEDQDICELAGKDLACFCALDKPCHGDVLIELLLAND